MMRILRKRTGNMGLRFVYFRSRRQTATVPIAPIWMSRFLFMRRTVRDGICLIRYAWQAVMWEGFMICAWRSMRGRRFSRHQSICVGNAVSRMALPRQNFWSHGIRTARRRYSNGGWRSTVPPMQAGVRAGSATRTVITTMSARWITIICIAVRRTVATRSVW